MMNRVAVLLFCVAIGLAQSKTYFVKLVTPVHSKTRKVSLLNGYLECKIERVVPEPCGALLLRFDKLQYKGTTTPLETEVVAWVNSKGHKGVDDEARPMTLETGELRSATSAIWLDEGAELRVRVP